MEKRMEMGMEMKKLTWALRRRGRERAAEVVTRCRDLAEISWWRDERRGGDREGWEGSLIRGDGEGLGSLGREGRQLRRPRVVVVAAMDGARRRWRERERERKTRRTKARDWKNDRARDWLAKNHANWMSPLEMIKDFCSHVTKMGFSSDLLKGKLLGCEH